MNVYLASKKPVFSNQLRALVFRSELHTEQKIVTLGPFLTIKEEENNVYEVTDLNENTLIIKVNNQRHTNVAKIIPFNIK